MRTLLAAQRTPIQTADARAEVEEVEAMLVAAQNKVVGILFSRLFV